MKKIVVTGAGGFIGSNLVNFLKSKGAWVRGVDIRKPLFEESKADEFVIADLREESAEDVFYDADEIYALASDVGGVGYLAKSDVSMFHNNHLIDLTTLRGAIKSKGKKILYVSSACVYPVSLQENETCVPLKEQDTDSHGVPENVYGMEKLLSENMFLSASKNNKLDIRIARPQNVYGLNDLFKGEKAKAIASLCYKTAIAKKNSSVEVWGDGKQKRSFCFVEDMVTGLWLLMNSNYQKPLNLSAVGSIEINKVIQILNKISHKNLKIKHNLNGTQGVRGRESDISLMKQTLNWEPSIGLEEGLKRTYNWIESQVKKEK